MQTNSYEAPVSLQKKHRFILLLSMIFFLVALFALVSRWTIAYPLIAFSCLFYLILIRLSRRRYTEAFTQALMVHSLPEPFIPVSYTASQNADGLLCQRGLIPNISCIPGAKQHHLLCGLLKDAPFSISEIAFVRKTEHVMHSIAGTLVTADHILPSQESWVILLGDPFVGFCSTEEFTGFEPVAHNDAWLIRECSVLRRKDGNADALDACFPLLSEASDMQPAALSAQEGSLTLFLPNCFFAPTKADPSKPIDMKTLRSFRLPGLTLINHLIYNARHE